MTFKKTLNDIEFKVIDGRLHCMYQQLTSLEGCPENVTDLVCGHNQLTSLDGCPDSVKTLWCFYNQLKSLDGCPNGVTELCCDSNQLKSLDGCPKGVTKLLCGHNQLKSLAGCPENVKMLKCYNNQLISLEGCPKNVTELNCDSNLLTSLEGCPESVVGLFCSKNQLTSLEGLPESVIVLDCGSNPLNSTYAGKSLKEIHSINQYKMNIQSIPYIKLKNGAYEPTCGSEFSVGSDLYAIEEYVIRPHGKSLISTGLAVEIPTGHFGWIAPRSSMGWEHHTSIGAGIIDSDYTGEIKVVLFNHSDEILKIHPGDRIAQLILLPYIKPKWIQKDKLPETERGSGGFGSTGK
uniref:dUTP diphosphatase n=1 Tax=Marseillevirus LCMAC102 TaxID=2506603 RepID=A0A481YU71_9VIRU|nr:MAG: dUTP diphosphatase [Marseillevirus LCMAC102]